MMINEKIILEGSLQSLDIASEFCKMADIDPLRATALPKWFFSADEDDVNKQFALFIDNIWCEANRLKMQFTDSIIPEISKLFPNLYRYVVGVKTGNVSFINCLSERCEQSTVALDLAVLMNQILEKYPHHMLWASDPMRYQALINAVRARRMRNAVDLDKSTRHGTNFQNRILKGFQMLALMDQYEKQDAIHMSEPNALSMQDINQVDDQKDKEGNAK